MMRSAISPLAAMWAGRAAREQVLLAAGAALCLALAAWFAVIDPVLGWRAAAGARHAEAVAGYEAVAAGLARYRALSSAAPANAAENETIRSVVAGAASRSGLVLSRVLPDEAGRLNVWIDAADPDLVMAWLGELAVRERIAVRRAALERLPGGQVRTQLLLARDGAA